jgi:hypothetical protein
VVNDLMERTGWTAPGMGFLCSGDVLSRYLAAAHVGTEIDLRLSLLALYDRREALLNAGSIMSAARRIVVNRGNFHAWCFYEPSYYLRKDINAPLKLDLNTPGPVEDLPADMVARFFERRALKLATRHLIPAVIFDRTGTFLERVGGVFGTDVIAGLHSGLGRLGGQGDLIPSNRFESMIRRIERHPVCVDLAHRIAGLMHRQYSGRLAPQAAVL